MSDHDQVTMDNEMSQEEILMNEDEMMKGLLEAAEYKENELLRKKVRISRGGKALFEFRVCPMSEEETQDIRKRCTKYAPNPAGRHLPKVEAEVNLVRMRSLRIYEATVPEDRQRVWDNPTVKRKLNVMEGWEVVDAVLMAGEKDQVIDLLDSISGFGTSLEEYAKN